MLHGDKQIYCFVSVVYTCICAYAAFLLRKNCFVFYFGHASMLGLWLTWYHFSGGSLYVALLTWTMSKGPCMYLLHVLHAGVTVNNHYNAKKTAGCGLRNTSTVHKQQRQACNVSTECISVMFTTVTQLVCTQCATHSDIVGMAGHHMHAVHCLAYKSTHSTSNPYALHPMPPCAFYHPAPSLHFLPRQVFHILG